MSAWKALIDGTTPLWTGIEGYAKERIAELVVICTTATYTDAEIRSAQARIAELRALLALPESIRSAEKHKHTTPRKGY
jgi:hypothetical protein